MRIILTAAAAHSSRPLRWPTRASGCSLVHASAIRDAPVQPVSFRHPRVWTAPRPRCTSIGPAQIASLGPIPRPWRTETAAPKWGPRPRDTRFHLPGLYRSRRPACLRQRPASSEICRCGAFAATSYPSLRWNTRKARAALAFTRTLFRTGSTVCEPSSCSIWSMEILSGISPSPPLWLWKLPGHRSRTGQDRTEALQTPLYLIRSTAVYRRQCPWPSAHSSEPGDAATRRACWWADHVSVHRLRSRNRRRSSNIRRVSSPRALSCELW